MRKNHLILVIAGVLALGLLTGRLTRLLGGDAADTALGICQQAADQAVKSLESAGG